MVNRESLGSLNFHQLRVARAHPGPVLVTGGPGTGKTAALIGRVAALLNSGISGENIFFLTTSPWRGADMRRELPGRLEPLAPTLPAERLATVPACTLEDFSASWLRAHGAAVLGNPTDFRVWNPRRAVRAAINLAGPEGHRVGLSDREVRGILRFHWLQQSRPLVSNAGAPAPWQEVLDLYQEEKRRENALAWYDLVPMAVQSMEQDPGHLEQWRQARSRHWLVDDFQNATPAGYRLLRLIAGQDASITVAADANQAIGSWRGADSGLIDRFRREHPNLQTFRLYINLRSTTRLAELVVRLSQEGSMDTLANEEGNCIYRRTPVEGEKPVLLTFPGEPAEMRAFVAQSLLRRHSSGVPWEEMAIICCRQASIDLMAPCLRARDIPYTVMGEDRWQGVAGPRPGIALSTIHASQGMQWREVWILDAADNILPGRTSHDNNSLRRLPEERRLLFVASTRASESLHFVYCRRGDSTAPTRFLKSALALDLLQDRTMSENATGDALDDSG